MSPYTGPERRDQSPRGRAVRKIAGLWIGTNVSSTEEMHANLAEALRQAYESGFWEGTRKMPQREPLVCARCGTRCGSGR